MKKDILVTLSDKNYVDQAKQLFSSVYFNANWKGDYMLLSYKIPEKELKWFRNKGIRIKKCSNLLSNKSKRRRSAIICKYYIFKPEFKKWKNIVFLDSDIIVRASLHKLTKAKVFSAVSDPFPKSRMFLESKKEKRIINKLCSSIKKGFNSGVMAFPSKIIKPDIFDAILNLNKKYSNLTFLIDQPALNIYFRNWKRLPVVYNLYPTICLFLPGINRKNLKSIILHFMTPDKPWNPSNPFYKEWEYNLKRADSMNISKPIERRWGGFKIHSYSLYMNLGLGINRFYSSIGRLLSEHCPQLYVLLKKIKV